MINPKILKTAMKKQPHPLLAGGKYYMGVLHGGGYGRATRRIFKRASEAKTYTEEVRQRWIRLYDAALISMASETHVPEVADADGKSARLTPAPLPAVEETEPTP